MHNTKILVTGSNGFIGSKLVQQLIQLGHDVIELNRTKGDISDKQTWARLPPVNIVIHLAALTFVPDSWNHPTAFMQTNLQGTICALEYCRKYDAKLVFMSSYMYGKPEFLPIPESAKLVAFNPYALSKKMAEEACYFYADYFNVKITILRPFNVYGPDQKGEFLIPSIIRQALDGKVIEVKVLEPKRDYIYINDVINCIIKAMYLSENFTVFNVGTGKSYSVAELIAIIQEIMHINLPVHASGENRPDEVMDTRADISKASQLMGWFPEFTLYQGIADILTLANSKTNNFLQ